MTESKTEEESIEDKAIRETLDLWKRFKNEMSYTHCTHCDDPIKRPCVVDISTMEAWCAHCWCKKKIDEMKRTKIVAKIVLPKLDLEDFVKL